MTSWSRASAYGASQLGRAAHRERLLRCPQTRCDFHCARHPSRLSSSLSTVRIALSWRTSVSCTGTTCRRHIGTFPIDGTFNNRRLDRFLAGIDSEHRAWLITVAGALGGFVMTAPTDPGGISIRDFFIVRALRRAGVGREAAGRVIAMIPGRWSIGYQSYNPGAQRFWSQVASDAVGTSGPRTTTRRPRAADLPTPGSPFRPETPRLCCPDSATFNGPSAIVTRRRHMARRARVDIRLGIALWRS